MDIFCLEYKRMYTKSLTFRCGPCWSYKEIWKTGQGRTLGVVEEVGYKAFFNTQKMPLTQQEKNTLFMDIGQIFTPFCIDQNGSGFTVTAKDCDLAYAVLSQSKA